ncbi:hypothetical protein [Pseudovibrio sp. Ad37]|uniref:hypothetical protein n=1 Tax=Pseudovibrio sp. Ad37 TaxID=989422 RepID=UPI0007AE5A63|nr:hypothetical protein [Pseudovibrio sp. Ad37]KZL18352.1 hypothetical protein PsAD37_03871 [Pseudovibrio sp. Ad37]
MFRMTLKYHEARGSSEEVPTLMIKRLGSLFGCKVQLHKFIREDNAECFHTHLAWAIRIVLRGGYIEELGNGELREWKPGNVGLVRPELEHRIHALRNGLFSYSLWLRGPKVRSIKLRGFPKS